MPKSVSFPTPVLTEPPVMSNEAIEAICPSRRSRPVPFTVTAAEGEETYEKLADMTIALVRALVDGTGGRDRSGLFGRV